MSQRRYDPSRIGIFTSHSTTNRLRTSIRLSGSSETLASAVQLPKCFGNALHCDVLPNNAIYLAVRATACTYVQ
jgi:hypothetical protein